MPLDVRGNYVLSDDQVRTTFQSPSFAESRSLTSSARLCEQAFTLRQYRRLIERCDANGVPRPAPPPNLPQAPVLADRVALPPVSFRGLA